MYEDQAEYTKIYILRFLKVKSQCYSIKHVVKHYSTYGRPLILNLCLIICELVSQNQQLNVSCTDIESSINIYLKAEAQNIKIIR